MPDDQASPASRTGLSTSKQLLLAQRLAGRTGSRAAATIPRRPAGSTAALSFAQQRLWFLDQLVPDSPFYNIPIAVRIARPIDVAIVARCLNESVRRHESLRT